jgi:hypothetical protein
MFVKLKEFTQDWTENKKKKLSQVKNIRSLTMCKQCYTFYYKNSWHFEKPDLLESNRETVLPVKFTQCPVCIEQENALFDVESDLVFGR